MTAWRFRDRPVRLLAGLLLALFALTAGTQAINYVTQHEALFPDFFAFWSAARLAVLEGPHRVYDPAALHAFQTGLEKLFGDRQFPFVYPPPYLLLIWPLGLLDYEAARAVWTGGTLGLFLIAVLAPRWRPSLALAALLAPATTISLVYGQNGFLSAALMIGGLRCACTRPVLAGVLLGLMSCKPQLALLLPVALAAGRLWRTMLWAGVTAACCIVASGATLGWDIWADWLAAGASQWQSMPALQESHANVMPTVSAALLLLGLGPAPVRAIQAAAALAAAAAVWTAWRRSPGEATAIAAVSVAALLATPYAFVYDLPLVAGAVLLIVADAQSRETAFGVPDLALLALALELPQLMFVSPAATLPIGAPVLALLLWRIMRLQARPSIIPAPA